MGKDRIPLMPLLVGGLLGLVVAVLFEWLFTEVVWLFPNLFALIVLISLILAFLFIAIGLYLANGRHSLSGVMFFVCGLKLLNWVILWYLPLYYDGYWGNLGQFFMFRG